MDTRAVIIEQMAEIVEGFSSLPFPEDISDETTLATLWLDSMAFVDLIGTLEEILGYVPVAIIEGEFYPQTVGEFVALYTTEPVDVSR